MRSFSSIKKTKTWGPKVSHVADSYVGKYLTEAMETWRVMVPPDPLSRYRVSSFPYCGILDLMSNLEPQPGVFSFKDQFYFGPGTAVHSLWQTAMCNAPMGAKAWGNWKCLGCGKQTAEPQHRPRRCSECKNDFWEYVEISFRYGMLTGHTDFVSVDDKGRYVGWELKTTGVEKIQRPQGQLPYPKHIVQIELYCALMWMVYGIRIHRYVIVYVSREKPNLRHATESVRFTRARLEARMDEIRASNKARSSVLKLLKPDQVKNVDENLRSLMIYRPCYSKQDYTDRMSSSFYGDECCAFMQAGVCARPKVNSLQDALRERLLAHLQSKVVKTKAKPTGTRK